MMRMPNGHPYKFAIYRKLCRDDHRSSANLQSYLMFFDTLRRTFLCAIYFRQYRTELVLKMRRQIFRQIV